MTAPHLPRLGWAPRNHALLERLLLEHGRGSPAYDPARPPFAVFDWDHTSAYGDVQETLFWMQVERFRFALTTDQLRALLPDIVCGQDRVPERRGRHLFADLHVDILAAFEHCARGARNDYYTRELGRKLYFVYEAYYETPEIGPAYAFRWLVHLLTGFTLAEVRELTREAIVRGLARAVAEVTCRSPREMGSRAGSISLRYQRGLRIQAEMQTLMHALRAAGIEVFIVTASLEEVVRVFATEAFGYHAPPGNVMGMRLAEDAAGRLIPRDAPGWTQPIREGKVAAIRAVHGPRGDPILVCGDSDGDAAMLDAFPGMRLGLIMNRLKGGEIGALSARAAAERASETPRLILQGRDERTGLFLPREETIPISGGEPRLLAMGKQA